jgi:two-component system sensor histidine kinase/response regulator
MRGKKITVLAIEDDPGDIHLVRRCLEDIPGWEVRFLPFTEPAEGLAQLSRGEEDIILLDYLLGSTTGLEVLKAIQHAGCKSPVVILTGHGHEELAAELMRFGAADYLPKNRLSSNSLRRVISNAIAKCKLQEALEKHRRNLQEANQELLRKSQEIQTFYQRLSSKLKSPVTSARGYVSLVLEGSAGPLTDAQSKYLNHIQHSCGQMLDCIRDLDDVTGLQTGELAITLSPISIDELVHEVMTSISPAAQKKNICLRNEIQQVLSHLLSNALKFTREGGQIRVRATESPLVPGFVVISVHDTGRGIEREKLRFVFDRLYQVSNDDWMTHRGLGLGLYICRELIKLHGGDMSVHSEPGRGSTFSFTVPIHVTQEASDPVVLEATQG